MEQKVTNLFVNLLTMSIFAARFSALWGFHLVHLQHQKEQGDAEYTSASRPLFTRNDSGL